MILSKTDFDVKLKKEAPQMVLIQAGIRSHSSNSSQEDRPEAGPVFVPSRRPSAFARQLMETDAETDDAVTAYDELWFAGRPTV